MGGKKIKLELKRVHSTDVQCCMLSSLTQAGILYPRGGAVASPGRDSQLTFRSEEHVKMQRGGSGIYEPSQIAQVCAAPLGARKW